MLPDKERMQILKKASAEIEAVCKKHGVCLTVSGGEFWLHHGEWHDRSGDYSVREVKLSKECHL